MDFSPIALFAPLVDFIMHIDIHLLSLAADYGLWLYLILFLIVFAETGLVVTPFLPGDSLFSLLDRSHLWLPQPLTLTFSFWCFSLPPSWATPSTTQLATR